MHSGPLTTQTHFVRQPLHKMSFPVFVIVVCATGALCVGEKNTLKEASKEVTRCMVQPSEGLQGMHIFVFTQGGKGVTHIGRNPARGQITLPPEV